MSDNLKLWDTHADIDPNYVKPITGKAYRGTSPNPQHIIKCLTDLFGPVGIGFGWRVVAEAFQPLGEETLHWCRIEFWHTDRANTFEAYGQTKAAYPTKSGGFMVDEDAPKKSLTDAIVKAASQIGVAANIFLGRWDDQKYVAEVAAEFRAEKRAAAYDPAPHIAAIEAATTGRELLAAIKAKGCDNAHEAIAAARVERLTALIKGAQSTEALDQFAKAFAADWVSVSGAAQMRRAELTTQAPF